MSAGQGYLLGQDHRQNRRLAALAPGCTTGPRMVHGRNKSEGTRSAAVSRTTRRPSFCGPAGTIGKQAPVRGRVPPAARPGSATFWPSNLDRQDLSSARNRTDDLKANDSAPTRCLAEKVPGRQQPHVTSPWLKRLFAGGSLDGKGGGTLWRFQHKDLRPGWETIINAHLWKH